MICKQENKGGAIMARKYWYQEAISHAGLNKYKVIKAESRKELQRKVALQKLQWEEQWIKKVEQEQRRLEREQSRMNIEQAKEYAAQRTAEAEEIQEILRLLRHQLNLPRKCFMPLFMQGYPQKMNAKVNARAWRTR